MPQMTPGGYEVIDHGLQRYDEFTGCGVALTGFSEVFTGIGDNAREAFEDAWEQACESGWTEAEPLQSEHDNAPLQPSVSGCVATNDLRAELAALERHLGTGASTDSFTFDPEQDEDCQTFLEDTHYYVSLRLK